MSDVVIGGMMPDTFYANSRTPKSCKGTTVGSGCVHYYTGTCGRCSNRVRRFHELRNERLARLNKETECTEQ